MTVRRGHFVIYVFLLALSGPASDVFAGQAGPAWLAGGALVVFAACWVLAIEAAHGLRVRPGGRDCAGPGAPARRAPRDDGGHCRRLGHGLRCVSWMVLFVFVVATGAAVVPLRWVPVEIVAVAALAVGTAVVRGWDEASAIVAGSWALSVVMAGFITFLLRRRSALIAELPAQDPGRGRATGRRRRRHGRTAALRADLHDLLGHSLSLIVLKAELARRLLERGDEDTQAQVEVSELEHIARRALVEVREAVAGYRTRSLAAELDRGRAALVAAGIELSETGVLVTQPPAADELLAWIVREAITNIVRHSSARRAEIAVTVTDAEVTLKVTDDGGSTSGSSGGTTPRHHRWHHTWPKWASQVSQQM